MTKEEFKQSVLRLAKISKKSNYGEAIYDAINETFGIGMDVEFETLIFTNEIEANLDKYIDAAYSIVEKRNLFEKNNGKNEEDYL